MRRVILWLFQALLFVTPFAFTAFNDELFEFNKMIVVYALTILIAGAWIARMIQEKRTIFTPTPFFWPLLLFLMSQTASTFFSIDPHTSIFGYYSRFHGGLLSTLSYLTLYWAAASNLQKTDLKPLIRATLLAGGLASLYALPEHFGVSPSCVLIAGDFSVSCWVQDVQTRIFGTFGQPNWLAAYILLIWPLALWLWSQTKKNTTDAALSLFVLIASFPTLLFTRSRSGLLGFGLEAGILGAVWLYWTLAKKKTTTFSRSLFTAAIIMFIFLACFGSPYSPSATELWQKISPQTAQVVTPSNSPSPTPSGTVLENGGTYSGEIRLIVWQGAFNVWKRYPLLGSGVETFAYSYYRDRLDAHNHVSEWDFLYNRAHNEFLNALATTGIFGLVSLCLLMGSFLFWLLRTLFHRNTSQDSTLLSLCLLAGYCGLAVSNFLGFQTVMTAVLFFLFPAFFVLQNAPDSHPTPSPVLTPNTAKTKRQRVDSVEVELDATWLAYALLLAGILAAELWVISLWNNDRLLASAKRWVLAREPVQAYQEFHQLTQNDPSEPVYWDEAAGFYAQLAVAVASNDATTSAQIAQEAIEASNHVIQLNAVHPGFWKSRSRTLTQLAAINPDTLLPALEALEQAEKLSPNDPKIFFHRAVLYETLEDPQKAQEAYEKAISLKPDYELARNNYGQFLERRDNIPGAIQQYRYISEVIKPGEEFSTGRLKALATASGIISK